MAVLEKTVSDDLITIAFHDSLNVRTAEHFRTALNSCAYDSPKRVLLDLRGCSLIDSTGLGILLFGSGNLEENGKRIAAVHANKQVRLVFEITHSDKIIRLFPNHEAALADPWFNFETDDEPE
jgi:anti-anti-sigma factor